MTQLDNNARNTRLREQLTAYLKKAGFGRIAVYANRSFSAPGEGEQRIYFKARKGIRK